MQELFDAAGLRLDYTRELLIVGLILGRTMPMVFLTPFLAGQLAPPEVKMGMGAVFTIILWPLAREAMTGDIPVQAFPYILLMLKETMIGFAIGFANAHIFYAMEMAGRIIDTVRGSSMAEVLVPHSRGRATPVGDLYYQMLVVFFVLIGGHHIFIEQFFFSFGALPINENIKTTPGFNDLAAYATYTTGHILLIATILSGPAIAATFITDVVFGILNRVAPQLNAYFMAMPVKAMAGIAMVLVAMEPFVARLEYYILWSLETVQSTIDLLKPR